MLCIIRAQLCITVFIFACYVKKDGWTKGDAFCNCGCRMELLAKTEGCKVDGSVMLWSRHLHSIFCMC